MRLFDNSFSKIDVINLLLIYLLLLLLLWEKLKLLREKINKIKLN
jgi:hypothetical protein